LIIADVLSCRALPGSTRALAVWLIVAAIAIGVHLGGSPLLDADEGRNGEVGREMAATNNYVVPHLNGLPYLDKPIVYFAAEAAAMEVLGPTEIAARLPAYVFTLFTAALVFWFANRRWGRIEALVATIAFLAMPLTIAFARTVIFDSALTFFIVLSIISFYEAVENRQRRWATLAWAAIAMGILTKGPVALALPLMIAIPFAIWRKSFRYLGSIGGLVAFVVIVTPWVWAMQQAVPDFLQYVLVTETAARLATDELKRTGALWYFVPYLVAGALPWTLAVATTWKREWRTDPRVVYLLLWIIVPFVFFSLSQSKRPQYILPLMPPIALLVAHGWAVLRIRVAAITIAVFGLLLVIAPLTPQFTERMKPVVIAPAKLAGFGLGAVFVAGGVVALFARRRELALAALSAPMLAIPLIAGPLMDALGERRSAKAFVQEMAQHLRPDTQIIGVEAFTGSMAFYARRPIIVASPDATEYTSNYLMRRYDRFRDAPGSTLRSMDWFRRDLEQCCQPRIYIVKTRDRHYQSLLESRGFPKIAEGAHHVVYSSKLSAPGSQEKPKTP
jgi:4-amino-4-deoxy-L-arabinose transferase-like glycosyltransferase